MPDAVETTDVEENSFKSEDTPEHSLPTPEEVRTEAAIRNAGSESSKSDEKDLRRLRHLGIFGILCLIALIASMTMFFIRRGSNAADDQNGVREVRARTYLQNELSNPNALDDNGSPEFRAMRWISSDDPLRVSIPHSKNDDSADEFMDRYVLALLFFSTGGSNWNNDMNFLTGKDICDWNKQFRDTEGEIHLLGAICSEGMLSMSVDEIWIPNNALNGVLPLDELLRFKSLRSLAFEYNVNLKGTLPEDIGDHLTNLENLSLSNNVFTGKLPASMSGMLSLKRLMIDDNAFTGVVSSVVNLPNLELVYMEDNFFNGEIDDTFFAAAPDLKHVDISNNDFSGTIPAHFFEESKLEVLDMHANFKIAGNIPQFPVEQTNLKVLALHKNSITGDIPASIGNLRGLQQLDLSENELSGDLTEAMGDLKELEYLFLAGNSFNEGPIPNFVRDLTKLMDLSLKGTNRIGMIPDWIGTDLKRLRLLDLDGNKLNGEIPETLTQLKTLVFLLLNRNQLTGQVPQNFTNLPLEVLVLDDNNLSGDLDFLCPVGDKNPLDYIVADCGGDDPEISCTEGACCRVCCSDEEVCNNKDWLANHDPIWENQFKRSSYIFGDGMNWVPSKGTNGN